MKRIMKTIFPKLAVFVLTFMTLSSCVLVFGVEDNKIKNENVTQSDNVSPTLGGKLYTSAWIQRSAEYKALCIQSYNLAKLRLDESLTKFHSKPLAIITDIDETILDNTPNAVHQALKGEDFTEESWDKWCDKAVADTLAGAKSFFEYAKSKGVEVFYISNRSEVNRTGTLANLAKFGFPFVDNNHILLRKTTSDKSSRRDAVEHNYEIVLFLGDNLGDFTHEYDSIDESIRLSNVYNDWNLFGKRFILIPNPNYGSWEKAMNNGYPPLKEKDMKLKKQLLKAY